MGIRVGGLVGLQGSLGGTGDAKAFPALLTCCPLFFMTLFGETGMLTSCLVLDFGDSNKKGNSSYLDLEEVVLFRNMSDDRECGLDALEDNNGLQGGLGRDLAEDGGLGVTSDKGLGDDEGVVISFESVLEVWIFLDFWQEVLRKPEFRRGRFRNASPNSSTELP